MLYLYFTLKMLTYFKMSCNHLHIVALFSSLQVVLLMYLWSIDIEAVLTSMSCFEFMCQEADILYAGDEQVIHQHVPNYTVYQEIASAYKGLTTGSLSLIYLIYSDCIIRHSYRLLLQFA